ncbi:unnamed protein product (macronuclear) [Paramecium tetraurelia]|uniref:Uncharacterized protein n=1 Tax=Paramecium tetraurelia TaxID=5888 RepID=A0CP62_PARTE|nr:uncharacterized protein GSPATT00008970001 [Paramecium tetraurelia]CAK72579.1 unnamed protein product [Paramecium tetraurelia]|eukprot:XP_001439976.1 hypothetical protein (macronuclear) [Paramecium tetraurelia strain d4-2]
MQFKEGQRIVEIFQKHNIIKIDGILNTIQRRDSNESKETNQYVRDKEKQDIENIRKELNLMLLQQNDRVVLIQYEQTSNVEKKQFILDQGVNAKLFNEKKSRN